MRTAEEIIDARNDGAEPLYWSRPHAERVALAHGVVLAEAEEDLRAPEGVRDAQRAFDAALVLLWLGY